MQEIEILGLDTKGLLSTELLERIYDTDDDVEIAVNKALIIARAKQLNIEKEIKKVLKVFDDENAKLDNAYKKARTESNMPVPLKINEKGMVVNSIENYLSILKNDKHFDGIKFNLLSYCPEKVVDGKTERWTDSDDSSARLYIEKKYKIYSKEKLENALRIIFAENEYHPVRDIIDKLQWDGVERITTLLIKWLGVEDTPYSREVSRLIFSGGINRLYNPGCKFDDVPVFIGTKQGEGKSTFIRWLAIKDEFFTEVGEIEGQKGIEILEGAWICEMSELLALTKVKEVEAVKGYITRQCDKYRMPFDKRVTEHPRQCVFIGTTNKEQFLTDKTGNRRWYPIKINQSGYALFDRKDEIKADILQCWAEAKYKFDKGEMLPYADRSLIDEIRRKQSAAVEDDYRQGMIESYLRGRQEVCVLELWERALQNREFSKPTKKDSIEIGLIMQSMDGWEKQTTSKRFDGYGKQRWWKCVREYETEVLDDDLPF